MGRAPCCDKANVKKGPWSPEEDTKLKDYIEKYGTGGNWIALPQKVGLKRCGKSCRLRWLNYLRPNIKHGEFSEAEDRVIYSFYTTIGSRWSIIASQLPGRTDNDIKNYWNTKLKKKSMGIRFSSSDQKSKWENLDFPLQFASQLQIQAQQSQFAPLPPCPSFFNPSTKPFLGLESSQILPNLMNTTNIFTNYNFGPCLETNFSLIPSSQEAMFGPMQGYNGNYPQAKETMLMFGADQVQVSCTSSDGSVSHGREMNQDEMGIYMANGGFQENPSFMLDFGKNSNETLMNTNEGYFGNNNAVTNNGLDQFGAIEEIKQLISSGTNDDNLYYNVDDGNQNKTQDQSNLYYY